MDSKAQRLSGGESDYDGLLELIGEASVVHIVSAAAAGR